LLDNKKIKEYLKEDNNNLNKSQVIIEIRKYFFLSNFLTWYQSLGVVEEEKGNLNINSSHHLNEGFKRIFKGISSR